MPFIRPVYTVSQRRFGRGPTRVEAATASGERGLTDDLRLFVATFAAGFLFVSILIG